MLLGPCICGRCWGPMVNNIRQVDQVSSIARTLQVTLVNRARSVASSSGAWYLSSQQSSIINLGQGRACRLLYEQ